MIVIDTFRFDRVGAYGANADITPFLSWYADRSSVFWQAYAQSSWTSPSVASIFTSRYQSQHSITTLNSVLADSEHTLAEAFKEHGYATGCFSGNSLINPGLGYGQGFDTFRNLGGLHEKGPAGEISLEALAWLDSLKKPGRPTPPAFLYLQYMDTHEPFVPPAAIADRILTQRSRSPQLHRAAAEFLAKPLSIGEVIVQKPPFITDLYDAEVLTVDRELQSLLWRLQQRGFLENTIVVITADHGEELFERGWLGHGRTLYNETIHIPLLLHLPSQTGRADIRDVVSQVDYGPTLLDLAGIPRPASFEGHSLRGLLRTSTLRWYAHSMWDRLTGRQAGGTAYSEQLLTDRLVRPHVRAIIEGNTKIILSENGTVEGYDLQTDPSERKPKALSPQTRHRLESDIHRLQARLGQSRSPAVTKQLDEKTKERLRVLGYLP